MSRRMLKSDDEEGFIRAFRDEIADTEAMYHVHISCSLVRPVKGSGLDIIMEARRAHLETVGEPWARVVLPYPTHAANTLYAALYRAAIRIGGAIAEQRRLEMGDYMRATNAEPGE